MQELYEVGKKLVPIMEVTNIVASKNKQLLPITHTSNNIQMAFSWLKEAIDTWRATAEPGDIETEGGTMDRMRESAMRAPSILNSMEQLKYIENNLLDLHRQLHYLEDKEFYPPMVRYKLDRTADHLMEGVFNIRIAKHYYEQINGSH